MLSIDEISVSGSYFLTTPANGSFNAILDNITGDNNELYIFKKITPEESLTEITVVDKNEYGNIWIVEKIT